MIFRIPQLLFSSSYSVNNASFSRIIIRNIQNKQKSVPEPRGIYYAWYIFYLENFNGLLSLSYNNYIKLQLFIFNKVNSLTPNPF